MSYRNNYHLSNGTPICRNILQKGHLHFGYGEGIDSRSISINQPYSANNTVKTSKILVTDEVLPNQPAISCTTTKPPSISTSSLGSHVSKFQMFPQPTDNENFAYKDYETVVLKKTAGNFGRVEMNRISHFKLLENKRSNTKNKPDNRNGRPTNKCKHCDILMANSSASEVRTSEICVNCITTKRYHLKESNNISYFSRHNTIADFSSRHHSVTPSLNRVGGKRPADWHLCVASHTIGR